MIGEREREREREREGEGEGEGEREREREGERGRGEETRVGMRVCPWMCTVSPFDLRLSPFPTAGFPLP